ncbi:hypothetical protein [Ralstonia sp. A12]|nr:hypothetical protein [Ralstonia sp. A12]
MSDQTRHVALPLPDAVRSSLDFSGTHGDPSAHALGQPTQLAAQAEA